MMKTSDAFPSKWIKEPDLQGRPSNLVMAACQMEEVGRKKDQMPVLYFQGKQKGLALNKTNWNMIASIHGDDSDGWIGKAIQLYPTTCPFENDPHKPCVRIRAVPVGTTATPPPTDPVTQADPYDQANQVGNNDPDIPF